MPRGYHKTCVSKCHNSYQDYRGGFSENLSITTAKNTKGSLPNDVGRSKRLCFLMFRFSAEDEVRSPTPSDGQSRKQKKTRRKNSLPHKIGRHRPSIGQHPDFHTKLEV